MLNELLSSLDPQPGDVVADCTLGYGGHAHEFLLRIGSKGRFVGIDVDADQLERTRDRLGSGDPLPRLSFHRSHFAGLGKIMSAEDLAGFDIIYADLGVSSMQIDDPSRGFSYKHDGPLDMRMDDRQLRTAADILARFSSEELYAAFTQLADEPDAKRIAEAVVRRCMARPITRTGQLVDLIFEVKSISRRQWRERPAEQRGQLHPAARTFQALRMLVNDEATGLAQFLRVAPHCLRPRGRMGIISFHSGEDRLVESAFRDGIDAGLYSRASATPESPTPGEIASNPRSRSALFRWALKADH